MNEKIFHMQACISNTTNLHATSCDLSIYVPTDAEILLSLLVSGVPYVNIQNWNNIHQKRLKGESKSYSDEVNVNPISFEYTNREFLNLETTRCNMLGYEYITEENTLTESGTELAKEIAFRMISKVATAEALMKSFVMRCRYNLAITNIGFEITSDTKDFNVLFYLDGVSTIESRLFNANVLQIIGNKKVPEFDIIPTDHVLFNKLRTEHRKKIIETTDIMINEVKSLMLQHLGYGINTSL